MKMKTVFNFSIVVLLFCTIFFQCPLSLSADEQVDTLKADEITKEVQRLMEEGDIPGLSLVIIRAGQPDFIRGFGYADLEKKKAVTPVTLFELCSTSKAFTALAVLKCEADGLISLDAPVSNYLPWFYTVYKGEKQKITIRQLLHQTSGMPFRSISRIPASRAGNALEQTVRNLVGIELDFAPGSRFQYATVNYDILGAVLEVATGMSYEDYMVKNIFRPLGLSHTLVGKGQLEGSKAEVAAGYKIGFFTARAYQAPAYRGNNPAGYIISNGLDMARWLKLQIGLEESPLSPLIRETQQRDRSVPPDPNTMLSYAMGWMPALDGSGMILHGGLNPNYSAQVMFNPEEKTGVVVLANSNSNFTPYIAGAVMNLVQGKALPPEVNLGDSVDKSCSVISFVLIFYLLCTVIFFIWVIMDLGKGRRRFEPLTLKKAGRLLGALGLFLPFVAGVWLLPYVLANVNWDTALVWSPTSFKVAAGLILSAMGISYLGYLFSVLFPQQNKYLRSAPFLVLISLLSGGANAVVIFLISMSLYVKVRLVYLVFYFALAGILYLVGRKVLQARLIRISFDIIYDLRMKLVDRIFNTSYQNFEKLDSGRVIATLNNDTNQLGGTANVFVTILSSLITILGAFLYLAALAFWATLVTIGVIVLVSVIYSVVTQKATGLFNIARNTQNEYLSLLNGLNSGFKELSIHSAKRVAYRGDVAGVTEKFRDVSCSAMVKFVNAFMVGESMLIMVLGAVAFAIPVLLPQIKTPTLMSFIMVLLYLIGPVTGILNAIPQFVQMRIAWQRVSGLMNDIPSNIQALDKPMLPAEVGEVGHIKANGVIFEYKAEDESENFVVGPLDFEAKKGEIVFVIGGNGSGKTTLAKLLTGLYIPAKGSIEIDGKAISNDQLGEYFSVVFGDFHLFEKLYDVDLHGKEQELKNHLEMLRLQDKVNVSENSFTTIDLSGGQRKRLALLRCYLEDRPIYLFDEVAADQDPEFRRFFYRDLLPKMKEKGKMVIAITHDDHYFDVADRVIKMDLGKIDLVGDGSLFSVTK
jgi:putative ATP-binding cassette transporter